MTSWMFDLTKARSALLGKPQFEPVAKAIDRFYAAASVLVDLRAARLSLETLAAVSSSGDPESRLTFGSALMTNALILYARATDTKNPSRYRVGATKPFNGVQRQKHAGLMELRNLAIAHVGTPLTQYQAWNDERIVMELTEEGAWFDIVWERANFRKQVVGDMVELLDIAIPHVSRLVDDRRQELGDAFGAVPDQDAFLSIIVAHPYDAGKYHDGSKRSGPTMALGEMFRREGAATWLLSTIRE